VRAGKLIKDLGPCGFRINGAYQLVCGDAINLRQRYELIDRQFVFIALQAVKPTGGDLKRRIAPFPSDTKTAFLDLSQ